jgi:hypothetical protein
MSSAESRIKIFASLAKANLTQSDRVAILELMNKHWPDLHSSEKAKAAAAAFEIKLVQNEGSLDLHFNQHANIPVNFRAQWAFRINDQLQLWPNNETIYSYNFSPSRALDKITLHSINQHTPGLKNPANWPKTRPLLLILQAFDADGNEISELKTIEAAISSSKDSSE